MKSTVFVCTQLSPDICQVAPVRMFGKCLGGVAMQDLTARLGEHTFHEPLSHAFSRMLARYYPYPPFALARLT